MASCSPAERQAGLVRRDRDGGGDRFADNANNHLARLRPLLTPVPATAGPSGEAQLSVENLTDHDYFVSATSALQIMPGTPVSCT